MNRPCPAASNFTATLFFVRVSVPRNTAPKQPCRRSMPSNMRHEEYHFQRNALNMYGAVQPTKILQARGLRLVRWEDGTYTSNSVGVASVQVASASHQNRGWPETVENSEHPKHCSKNMSCGGMTYMYIYTRAIYIYVIHECIIPGSADHARLYDKYSVRHII